MPAQNQRHLLAKETWKWILCGKTYGIRPVSIVRTRRAVDLLSTDMRFLHDAQIDQGNTKLFNTAHSQAQVIHRRLHDNARARNIFRTNGCATYGSK